MDSLFSTLISGLLITIVLLLIYRLYPRTHAYWRKKGVPYVEYDIFSEIFPSANEKTVQEIQIERRDKYGRIYGYYEKNAPVISVSDPELLKDILVKDFKYLSNRRNDDDSLDAFSARMLNNLIYEDWRRIRTIVSPTFSTGKLKKLLPIFKDCSKTLVKNFRKAWIAQNHLDIRRFFQAFALDVIGSTSFSTRLDSINNPESRFVKEAQKLFKQCSLLKLVLFNLMTRIFGPKSLKLLYVSKQLKFFERAAKQVVKERRRDGQEKNDLLQLLLNASMEFEEGVKNEDEDFNHIAQHYKDEMKKNYSANKSLNEDEVVAQCGMSFLVGHHTVALTLIFAVYLLAEHQDVQEKVHREIKDILEESKGALNSEVLHRMTYLDKVISETLRMYPPAPKLERIANTDYELGSTGIRICKGMKVTVPVFALHRDPEFFPRPHHFDPDRFDESNLSQIMPYSYLPFGAGPRNCVAMRFGLLEIKVCLVYLLSTFHIQTCSHTKVPLEFYNGRHLMPFTNLLPKEIKVKMVPREESPLQE